MTERSEVFANMMNFTALNLFIFEQLKYFPEMFTNRLSKMIKMSKIRQKEVFLMLPADFLNVTDDIS